MVNSVEDVKKTLNFRKAFITVLIGFSIVGILIYRDKNFTLHNLALIKNIDIKYLLFSVFLVVVRDLLYILRIRLLVRKEISFINCFIIIALWEFSSSITPSAVGGGFIAVLFFLHEGISIGRAIAYVMITATFDNYFFLLISPVGFLFSNFSSTTISGLYITSYILILVYSTIMTCSVFVKPEIFKYIVLKVTNIWFLKRYKPSAEKSANDMINSSKILKEYGLNFWILILFITLLTWISRYLVLNSVVQCFEHLSLAEHIEVFCRHLVLWVTMLISPTPGGSGIIEYIFNEFYHHILNDYSIIVIIIWRILTFYLYIFLGLLLLPGWIRTFKRKKLAMDNDSDIKNITCAGKGS